jgi:hypothetical protein
MGCNFLNITEQKFKECDLEIGPAMRLAKFAKKCKNKKLKTFSTYRSLKEVLIASLPRVQRLYPFSYYKSTKFQMTINISNCVI